jgi:hypothetical protein
MASADPFESFFTEARSMHRTSLWFVLAALLLVAHADGADDGGSVRRQIAGYRDWKPTTDRPIIVPPQISAACAPAARPEERNPHELRSILVYVNPTGRAAYDRKTSFPDGTVIVKEKLGRTPDDKTLQLGVMIKHGKSWEYSYIETDGTLAAGERLLHCARCHAGAKNDSVFGRAAPTGNTIPTGNAPGANSNLPNGKF